MLRDEAEVALNELVKLAEASAEAYGRAADGARSGEFVEMFRTLAVRRRRMAEELRSHDRSLGDIPHAPDPDLSTARDLWARLKSTLAADEQRALVEDCEATEKALADRMAAVLDIPLPPPTAALLRHLQYEVVAAAGRLAALRARY